MISGFLIVIKETIPNYYFSVDKREKCLKVSDKFYCGVGRSWDYWVPSKAPQKIRELVANAEYNYSQNLMFSLLSQKEDALTVLSWLNEFDGDQYEVIEVSVNEISNEKNEQVGNHIGIDIDCNSCYPVKEELFAAEMTGSIHSEFKPFLNILNENGLFDDIADAKRFMNCYMKIQDEYNIERVDNTCTSYIYVSRVQAL